MQAKNQTPKKCSDYFAANQNLSFLLSCSDHGRKLQNACLKERFRAAIMCAVVDLTPIITVASGLKVKRKRL